MIKFNLMDQNNQKFTHKLMTIIVLHCKENYDESRESI